MITRMTLTVKETMLATVQKIGRKRLFCRLVSGLGPAGGGVEDEGAVNDGAEGEGVELTTAGFALGRFTIGGFLASEN